MNTRVLRSSLRTTGALALLLVPLPANLALTGTALVRSRFRTAERAVAAHPQTVLLSGGKMTKALQLARSFHAAGHRVVLVEQAKYAMTGHRFSQAVDAFYTVPEPQDPGYAEALLEIVQREGVDVYVPVCSPLSSWYDALAKELLEPWCEVVHGSPDNIRAVDDKAEFACLAAGSGLSVPDSHRITTPSQVLDFDFAAHPGDYILKSIRYDPVGRLDLTRLPLGSREETEAFLSTKVISAERPWILQSFAPGQEYCTHTTVRDGVVQVYLCCESSAFQLNYAMVDKPEIEAWVRRFVGELGLTGQYSFDLIEAADGTVSAIECNPRTHSAITMLYDHPGVARAYLEDGAPLVTPLASSRPTYWTYWELWRLVTSPSLDRVRTLARGKDAIFDWDDPLPFLMVHHLQIPWLLLQNLLHGREWKRIDVNIGKLVEPAGD